MLPLNFLESENCKIWNVFKNINYISVSNYLNCLQTAVWKPRIFHQIWCKYILENYILKEFSAIEGNPCSFSSYIELFLEIGSVQNSRTIFWFSLPKVTLISRIWFKFRLERREPKSRIQWYKNYHKISHFHGLKLDYNLLLFSLTNDHFSSTLIFKVRQQLFLKKWCAILNSIAKIDEKGRSRYIFPSKYLYRINSNFAIFF